MPGFDRTGPEGRGAMTGGAWGNCGASAGEFTGNANRPARGAAFGCRRRGGMGAGRGWGRGRGFGRNAYGPAGQGYGAPATGNTELDALKAEAEDARNRLAALKNRISSLEVPGEGSA